MIAAAFAQARTFHKKQPHAPDTPAAPAFSARAQHQLCKVTPRRASALANESAGEPLLGHQQPLQASLRNDRDCGFNGLSGS